MNILLYLYDNLLVILYSGACLMAFCNYLKKKKRYSIYISVFFFCLLLSQLITSMVEFIPGFASIYDAAYRSMPISNTVISISAAICLMKLFFLFTHNKRIVKYEYFILLTISLLLLIFPTLKNSLTNLYLYTAVFLAYLLYRGVLFCYILHKKSPVYLHGSYWRIYNIFSYITILLPLLALMEIYVKIFYLYPNSDTYSYRIYSLDLLYGMAAFLFLYISIYNEALSEKCETANVALKSQISESASDIYSEAEIGIFHTFCDLYSLTPREQTILKELLNHTTYYQISNKLLISSYTVKKHVHNICQKTAVKSGQQLSDLYENYKHSHLS